MTFKIDIPMQNPTEENPYVVEGTDIKITRFDPESGVIIFKVDKDIEGMSMSRVLNLISFMFKSTVESGSAKVSYQVE